MELTTITEAGTATPQHEPTALSGSDAATETAADAAVETAGGSCCGGAHGSGAHPDGEPMAPGGHGYMGNKEGYLRRLKRIEGQARGIHRMVEEEQYCIDILTQISAVTKALQVVGLGLLEDHLNHCVLSAARAGGQEAEDKMAEATEAIARLVRS